MHAPLNKIEFQSNCSYNIHICLHSATAYDITSTLIMKISRFASFFFLSNSAQSFSLSDAYCCGRRSKTKIMKYTVKLSTWLCLTLSVPIRIREERELIVATSACALRIRTFRHVHKMIQNSNESQRKRVIIENCRRSKRRITDNSPERTHFKLLNLESTAMIPR